MKMLSGRPRRFLIAYVCCLILPLLYLLWIVMMKNAIGPYWLGSNIDPAYQYLLNGLNLLQGVTPTHVDHPGTTLQLLCAAVIAVTSWFRPEPLLRDFFTYPEFYMQAVSWTLIVLQVLSHGALGIVAYRKTGHVVFALLTQLPTLMLVAIMSYPSFGGVLTVPVNVFPETLLVTLTHLFMIGLLTIAFPAKDKPCWGWQAVYLGVIVGLALVTKISFGALILIPLVLLRHWGARVLYGVVSLVTFGVATIPVWSRYDKMFAFMTGIFTKSGRHGMGEGPWLVMQDIVASSSVLVEHKLILVLTFVGVVVGGFVLWLWRHRRFSGPEGVLLMVVVTMAMQAFLILRHFSDHYMTPLLCLMGLGLALIYWLLRDQVYVRVVSGIVFLSLLVAYNGNAMVYHQELLQREESLLNLAEHTQHIQQQTGCMVVPFFRSSSVPYALVYGLIQGGGWGHQPYVDVLKEVYPGRLFYHKWAGMMHDFYQMIPLPVAMEYLRQQQICVMMYGQSMELDQHRFDVEMIQESGFRGGEALFLLKGMGR